MDVQKVGQFLATLRKERGLTQDELGQRVGVTNKTISRWETGTYFPSSKASYVRQIICWNFIQFDFPPLEYIISTIRQ